MNKLILFYMLLFLFIFPLPSYAYIGPGMGAGVVAVIFGFFAAIFLALWAILYYPIKRAIIRRRDRKGIGNKSDNKTK